MRALIAIACLFVLCTSAHALDPSQLQGKWVITLVEGMPDDGDRSDVWEFKGDQWIVWTGKHSLPPDRYTIDGDTIDLGYAKIKVLEISADRMRTEQMGFVYRLERVK